MNWFGVLFWLIPRRLRASWVFLAITGFGVLAAVTALAVGALYSRALAEGGLRHSLATADPVSLNIQMVAQNRPLGPADYERLRATVEETAQGRLGFMLRDKQRFGRTQADWPVTAEPVQPSPFLGGVTGRPFFLTGFQEHSRLVAGRWPGAEPGTDAAGRLRLEVAVGDKTAGAMRWEVGAEAVILPYPSDLFEQISIAVVGIVEPVEPDAEYWMGFPTYFSPREYGDVIVMPLYVPEAAFFDGLGARYPTLVGDFGWHLYLDTGVLTGDRVQSTREAINGLETDINKQVPRSLTLTRLENSRGTGLLATYQRDLTRARAPIYLFIALVVVVILYFLALAAGLLAHSRSAEAGLLRSRGAGAAQVGGVITMTEALLTLLAVLVGPLLALLIFRGLLQGSVDPRGGLNPETVGLGADMFLLGGIGGLLSLSVLLLSNAALARRGLLDFLRERARPPTLPWVQRYYVDLLVVALLALVWWQVERRGGFLEQALTGREAALDWSLLLTPALALLAAAVLLLRIMPGLLRGMAWLARRAAPAWVSFALTRMAREPLPYGALAVMLLLAAALGVFGASFQSTLARSQGEQALYRAGGDLVVNVVAPTEAMGENLKALPAVRAFSPVIREGVTLLDGQPGDAALLLGVDPATFPETAWFREDFAPAGKGLAELLTPLRRGEFGLPDRSGTSAAGVSIPEGAERVGVWVNADALGGSIVTQSLRLQLRVADARGSYINLDLGDIDLAGRGVGFPPGAMPEGDRGAGWSYFAADLPTDKAWLEPPFRAVALYFVGKSLYRMPPGVIYVDDLTAEPGPAGSREGMVIEGFEEPGRWTAMPHDGETVDTIEIGSQAGRNGGNGLAFGWQDPILRAPRGILIPPGPFPLPAIGGPGLNIGQQLRLDTGSQLAPVVVADKADYFPTAGSSGSKPFLIVSLDSFDAYTARLPEGIHRPPREYWLALVADADREQVIQAAREATSVSATIRDRADLVDRARRNPLAGGGWDGLTLLSLGALAVAATLALGAHALAAARAGRVELTVARALGFSRRQLAGALALERLVAAVIGLAAGTVVGSLLSRWTLGLLGQTASGRPIVPPPALTVQDWIVGATLLSLTAAALVAIALAVAAATRLRAADILRGGE